MLTNLIKKKVVKNKGDGVVDKIDFIPTKIQCFIVTLAPAVQELFSVCSNCWIVNHTEV